MLLILMETLVCTRSDVKRDQLPEAIWARQKSNVEFHRGLEAAGLRRSWSCELESGMGWA